MQHVACREARQPRSKAKPEAPRGEAAGRKEGAAMAAAEAGAPTKTLRTRAATTRISC